MKKLHIIKLGSILAVGGLLAFGQVARADVEVSMTTASGTVSEFAPDAFVVRTEASTAPSRYVVSKETTFVDEAGGPVDIKTVKLIGNPVRITYVKEGDRMIARKVIVSKRTTTTTTTTEK